MALSISISNILMPSNLSYMILFPKLVHNMLKIVIMYAPFLVLDPNCKFHHHSSIKLKECNRVDCEPYMQYELQQYLPLKIQKMLHKQHPECHL